MRLCGVITTNLFDHPVPVRGPCWLRTGGQRANPVVHARIVMSLNCHIRLRIYMKGVGMTHPTWGTPGIEIF